MRLIVFRPDLTETVNWALQTNYLPTYLPSYLPTYLPTYLTYLPTYLHTHLPTYIPIYLPIPTYLPTYLSVSLRRQVGVKQMKENSRESESRLAHGSMEVSG